VYLSTAFQLANVGTRARAWAACLGSNWGDLSFRIFSRFHTTTSASKSEPSWNFTPWRNLKIHLVGSPSTADHSVARPGRMSAMVSAFDRSQFTSAS
jgi:hypothetical protein